MRNIRANCMHSRAVIQLCAMGAVLALGFAINARPDTHQVAGPELPQAPGKAIVQRACTTCHTAEMITRKRATLSEWSATVDEMVNRGAELTDEEIPTVSHYLAASFPSASDSGTKTSPGGKGKTP